MAGADGGGIEHHDIGRPALGEAAATGDAEDLGRAESGTRGGEILVRRGAGGPVPERNPEQAGDAGDQEGRTPAVVYGQPDSEWGREHCSAA